MKVKLYCRAGDSETLTAIVEVPDNTTDEKLQEIAENFYESEMLPEWWFKKLEENKEEV